MEELMSDTDMDLLLVALEQYDEDKVESLASSLFITDKGNCNWTNIKAFERLSGCVIFGADKESFGWLVGGIRFKGKVFIYG
jgi:hypothetical protein